MKVYFVAVTDMTGTTCIVCKQTKKKGDSISMYRIPSCPIKRKEWIECLSLDEASLRDHQSVCSKHFPHGDQTQKPSLTLGQKFVSPMKRTTDRGKWAKKRRTLFVAPKAKRSLPSREVQLATPSGSDEQQSQSVIPMFASVGEQLMSSSDYSVHELLYLDGECSFAKSADTSDTNVLVNKALVSCIEFLETQNTRLQSALRCKRPEFFRLENIASNDKLVKFYTGFSSYAILLAFFHFLGPAVNNLTYMGTKRKEKRRRMKIDPLNRLFLTLVKLRLNVRERDLAYRFGISVGTVSKYFVTWVCFLYHTFRDISWMPSVEQVKGTLPHAFKDKYPDTYTIVDGSEVFIETPSDLHMQSSTWSEYKSHNTAKFFIGMRS